MSSSIQQLLEELYALEPALREKEGTIIQIIERLQKNRPEITLDDDFKAELKERILREFRVKGTKKSWNFKFILAGFSTLAVASFAVFSLTNMLGTKDTLVPTQSTGELQKKTLSFAPVVQSTSQNAFGKIILQNQPSGTNFERGNMSENPNKRNAEAVGGVADSTAKIAATDAMMVPSDFPHFVYSFTGTLPVYTGALTVYKKTNIGFDASTTASILSSFAFDTLSIGAFQNVDLSNMSFLEDKEFGYMVNIDFANGNISLSQNWQKWPQPKCDENGCAQTPLTQNDIPSDDEFARITDAFLAQYGIQKTLYGKPQVDSAPRIMYARAIAAGETPFISDQYTVTYPLVIEGKDIYNEYGGLKGLSLTVDIRTKKVVGMYGLEKENRISSVYTNMTDTETMNKIIKSGGRYETRPYDGQKTAEVVLGEPTIQYVYAMGEWKDGKADEYYIPAYVFKVPTQDTMFGPTIIAVPLVKDFATFTAAQDGGVAKPMPIILEGPQLR